jgi:hypothetical protein
MLKQIPAAMTDPIAIFDSATEREFGDIVFMLELKDKSGKTVVAPVALQARGGSRGRREINIVKSAYGKGGTTPAVKWFLAQAKENARYMNGQKVTDWAQAAGVQFPIGATSNQYGNTVYTEADLVNLRLQNPEMYSGGARNPLGSVSIYPKGYLIRLFRGANLSTLLHETGHIFFEEMDRAVTLGIADKAMRRDHAMLRDWLGAKEGERLSVAQKEQLAGGFEAYLMEGKAPSKELEGGFSRFRKWLLAVYRTVPNPRVELTDEVRGVFGRMLATERKIVKAAALEKIQATPLDAAGEFSARIITQLKMGETPWQIPGLAEKSEAARPGDPLEKAESVLSASGVAFVHDQTTRAYYKPEKDEIHLPPKESFDNPAGYYSAAFRELAHSSRSPERLDRECGPYGSKKYALEELRVEIAAWVICKGLGIAFDPGDQTACASSARSWIRALQDDPREILRVFRDAEEIVGYVADAAPALRGTVSFPEVGRLLNGPGGKTERESDAFPRPKVEEPALDVPVKRARGWSR